eukprot:SAG31_NODE_5607_length_2425_cov_2.619651_2_plen_44_part_00
MCGVRPHHTLDHILARQLDAVVNWLENLDLSGKCELSSGLEAE